MCLLCVHKFSPAQANRLLYDCFEEQLTDSKSLRDSLLTIVMAPAMAISGARVASSVPQLPRSVRRSVSKAARKVYKTMVKPVTASADSKEFEKFSTALAASVLLSMNNTQAAQAATVVPEVAGNNVEITQTGAVASSIGGETMSVSTRVDLANGSSNVAELPDVSAVARPSIG